jgi:hypothetical protein
LDAKNNGVRNAWVLDPLERRAWVVNLANGSMIPSTELKTPGTEIRVPLHEIFDADFLRNDRRGLSSDFRRKVSRGQL